MYKIIKFIINKIKQLIQWNFIIFIMSLCILTITARDITNNKLNEIAKQKTKLNDLQQECNDLKVKEITIPTYTNIKLLLIKKNIDLIEKPRPYIIYIN